MNEAELVRKDIDNICCIYASVGAAMFDEPRERLALRIAQRHDKQLEDLREVIESYSRIATCYRLGIQTSYTDIDVVRDYHAKQQAAAAGGV
jgi:hypothetical protein